METLQRLIGVRSQLALGVQAYLEAIVALDVPGWTFVGGRDRFWQVYEWPDVVARAPAARPEMRIERDADEDDDRGEFARRVKADDRQRWFAHPDADAEVAQSWEPRRRILVIGRPGEGKSALTQMSAQKLAADALAVLNARTTRLSDLAIPLWARVDDVVRHESVALAVEQGLREILAHAFARSDGSLGGSSEAWPNIAQVAIHLATMLTHRTATLFLDALDERHEATPARRPWGEAFRDLPRLTCRVVVTSRDHPNVRNDAASLNLFSRTRAEDETDTAGAEYDLAPLTSGQQRGFVWRWFGRGDAFEQVAGLLSAHASLEDMASNALLLTLICKSGSGLDPKTARRVHLYDAAVGDMLRGVHRTLKVSETTKEEAHQLVLDRLRVLSNVTATLFEKHPQSFPEFVWETALRAACQRCLRDEPPSFLRDLQVDLKEGGLLVSPERGQLKFLHPTFYEYLAAVGLALDGTARVIDTLTGPHTSDQWRQVALFAVSYLAVILKDQDGASAVVAALSACPPGRITAWVGEALVEAGERDPRIEPMRFESSSPCVTVTSAARDAIASALIATMRDDNVPAKVRAEAGTSLGQIGDPRFDANAWWLPSDRGDLLSGFIKMPAGRFRMGNDKARDPDVRYERTDEVVKPPFDITPSMTLGEFIKIGEMLGPFIADILKARRPDPVDSHEVTVGSPFHIARWPVTVAQYRAYVKDSGHASDSYLYCVLNHPIVRVSWHEAVAYCDWLGKKLQDPRDGLGPLAQEFDRVYGAGRWRVRLPTEAEWEWTARGTEARTYPWGNTFDANRTNCRETDIGGTTTVGCFPGGATPAYGVEELGGNIWEWVQTEYRPYPYRSDDGRENADLSSSHSRVIRGGAYHVGSPDVRAAWRLYWQPNMRLPHMGFRVVVSPFSSASDLS